MRILFLSSSYHPLTGGAETYGRTLARGLVRRGHEVVVVTDGSWLPDLPVRQEEDGVLVLRLREFADRVDARDKVKWRQMQFSLFPEIAELAGDLAVDLIHANSHEALVLGSIIGLDLDVPVVASLHEQNPDLEAYGIGRCRLSYQVLPVAMYLVASQFYAARAAHFGVPAERVRLIYHGVEGNAPRMDARERVRGVLGIAPDAPVVLCPARVYTRKGQHVLARAIPEIRRCVPTTRFVLAGRVSDFEYARQMWRILDEVNARDAVVLAENYEGSDMPDVFAACDVVVQPSLEEGLGLATIEAMAAGRPVVASNVVGLSEVITDGHDGLLVPAVDPAALADATVQLLRDPGLAAALARSARVTVTRRFTQERMVDDTIAAYEAARGSADA